MSNKLFRIEINEEKFDDVCALIEESIKNGAEKSALALLSVFYHNRTNKDDENKKIFIWKNLSRENLQVAQKVIGVTFNYLQFNPPLDTMSLITRIPLQKYESEQICFDDVRAVLKNVEGIRVKNNSYSQDIDKQLNRYQEIEAAGSTQFIAMDKAELDALTAHLPSKEELKQYIFLEINPENDLSRVKKFIDARLQVGPTINSAEDLRAAVEIEQFSKKLDEMRGDITESEEETETARKEEEGTKGKPQTLVKDGIGYFKFYKEGELIRIGKQGTRHYRLLDVLCNPHFGVQKTIEGVFEAIRKPKDKNDAILNDYGTKKQRMLELIGFAIKELQKNKKLQGKLKYKSSEQSIWVEREG